MPRRKVSSEEQDSDYSKKMQKNSQSPQMEDKQKKQITKESLRPRRRIQSNPKNYAQDLDEKYIDMMEEEQKDQQVGRKSKKDKAQDDLGLDSQPIGHIIWKRQRQNTNEEEYLVKFKQRSYRECQWLNQQQLVQTKTHNINSKIQNFNKKFVNLLEQGNYDKVAVQNGEYFDQNWVEADRILTSTEIFPIIHSKKATQIKGQWHESLQLITSKLLNFVKAKLQYGVPFMQFVNGSEIKPMEWGQPIDLGMISNKVYLGVYKKYSDFWADIGKVWKSFQVLSKESEDSDRQIIRLTMKEASVFLYYQWYHLSEERYSKMRKEIRLQHKFDISDSQQTPQQEAKKEQKNEKDNPDKNSENELQVLNIDKFSKNNILLGQKKADIPNDRQGLAKFDPGEYTYQWFMDTHYDSDFYLNFQYQYLDLIDMEQLDLNKETDILYLVKWKNQSYRQATWEKGSTLDFPDVMTHFKNSNKALNKQTRLQFEKDRKAHLRLLTQLSNMNYRVVQGLQRQLYFIGAIKKDPHRYNSSNAPVFKNGKILRSYQLDGVNWLIKNWHEDRNVILGDEMGLGKTMQTIAFLHHLLTYENVKGPFLIIVPLSTLIQWKRAFQDWTNMNCVVYHDDKSEIGRQTIKYYEWYYMTITLQGSRIPSKCNKFKVLLTTYQMLKTDLQVMIEIPFQYIVLDEAHRLKSRLSQNLEALKKLPCKRKLLLTGTPIQNNTMELWTLLNYVQPEHFRDPLDFVKKYGNLETEEQLLEFSQKLKPYLLRRMKEDVQKSIPPIQEIIIDVELTNIQKAYYKGLYEKNKGKIMGSLSKTSFNCLQMQLRKCCNHPFLISPAVEHQLTQFCQNDEEILAKMVTSSGKMVLLRKLLSKFKEQGKKVLIFSQFTSMLDVLENYLRFQGFIYQRFDGSTANSLRQDAIDRFNHPNKMRDVFLISTKAGGVGINLTSATVIIIYDSDWNPQNDTQAIARAHRIGQNKEVTVYRLITSKTYEAQMFQRASKKLGLDKAVLYGGDFRNSNDEGRMTKDEIETLLKKGIVGLINQENNEEFFERNIDEILQKNTRLVKYEIGKNTGASISKSKFVGDNTNSQLQLNDPDFWKKALVTNDGSLADKLLKKYKDFKGEFTIEKQRQFLIEAAKVMDLVIQSKKSLQHYSLDEENKLQQFLSWINGNRKIHTQYRSLVESWSQDIERPPRRYRKPTIQDFDIAPPKQNSQKVIQRRRLQNYKESSGQNSMEEVPEQEEEDNEVLKEKALIPCGVCQLPNCSYFCNGLCGKGFHELCKDNPAQIPPYVKIHQLSMTTEELLKQITTKFKCDDCENQMVVCHICHKKGKYTLESQDSSGNSEDSALKEMQLVSCSKCDNFYHFKCMKDAQESETEKFIFQYKKNKKKETVIICPQHYCFKCQKGNSNLFSCLRCPKSYHIGCIGNEEMLKCFDKYCICISHLNQTEIKQKKETYTALQKPKKKVMNDKRKQKQSEKEIDKNTNQKNETEKRIQKSGLQKQKTQPQMTKEIGKSETKPVTRKSAKNKEGKIYLHYLDFGILPPNQIKYQDYEDNWCRYCGARYSSGFVDSRWGEKTLCKIHEGKQSLAEEQGQKNITQPLNPDENKQLSYLNEFSQKHKTLKPQDIVSALFTSKKVKKN